MKNEEKGRSMVILRLSTSFSRSSAHSAELLAFRSDALYCSRSSSNRSGIYSGISKPRDQEVTESNASCGPALSLGIRGIAASRQYDLPIQQTESYGDSIASIPSSV